MNDVQLIFTTTDSRASAQALARALVQARLAACVQIETIDSVYEWNGAIQEAREFRLCIKTAATQARAAIDLIRAQHPYELPAIWWSAAQSSPEYAAWVAAQTGPAP